MKFNLFKKKEKKPETNDVDLLKLLVEYIKAMRAAGYSEERIKSDIEKKNYPKKITELALLFSEEMKGGKMVKSKVEENFEDEEDEQEEEDEEEESDEPIAKPKPKPKVEAKEITREQISAILGNHENRIREVEAAIFRLKSI